MKNILYIIFFLIISFLLNISLYYVSSDYRNFLKEIKGIDEETKYVQENDNLDLEDDSETNKVDYNVNIDDVISKDSSKTNTDNNWNIQSKINTVSSGAIEKINEDDDIETVKVEYISVYDELKITKIEEEILKKFSEYDLTQIELHPRLFDLTSEYPDNYFEYYSEYLTLYFFWNKPYDEIKDVFQVLTYELPFSINEVDNFADKSFYINLDEQFQDWVVRLVLLYKNRTFWFKIKKELYDHVKEKLSSLDTWDSEY